MAHLIQEHDKGAVHGKTWHKLAQYITLETAVPVETVRAIADYPMELRPNLVAIETAEGIRYVESGSRAIFRPDINEVIVPSVGDEFDLENNLFLSEHIEANILDVFKDVEVDSVGTLRNGATFFINLKVKEFAVTGDKSPTVSCLMFQNPLGRGSYKCGVHDVRIVCNNTLRAAEAQAATNGSLFKIRHTKGARVAIASAMDQMAEFRLGLERHIEALEILARRQVSFLEVTKFLETMFPMGGDSSKVSMRKINNVWDARYEVQGIFEGDQDMTGGTAYALLNAFTYKVDHRDAGSQNDAAHVQWEGLYGDAAKSKDKALATLMELATV